MSTQTSLLGLSVAELKEVAQKVGLKPFVGKQMADWIYGKHVTDIDQMANISKDARAKLKALYTIGCSTPIDEQRSVDGTVKYLYTTAKGDFIETVYIPDGNRATLCVSSQVGCKMGCAFCMTGRQGYVASLSATDILARTRHANQCSVYGTRRTIRQSRQCAQSYSSANSRLGLGMES